MRIDYMSDSVKDSGSGRVISIDALRGFDMFWIAGGDAIFRSLNKIFGNEITACINTQLRHVEWEGFVFEDLIMPLFLFIAGVSMPFAFTKRVERGNGMAKLLLHVIKRVAILWVLGMVVQGNLLKFDWPELKFYSNTLQAIAAGYLIAAVGVLLLKVRGQAILAVSLMIIYWLLMTFVPVPNHGAGVLTADGNLAIYIDKLILGAHQDGTSYTWILSSITFGSTVLIGVLAGHWLKSSRTGLVKAGGLAAAGVVCIVAGFVWGKCGFPIIKHLWTSSMVLYAGGWSLLLLAIFYLVMDVWKLRRWAFGFVVLGANAITIYVGWHVFHGSFRQASSSLVGGLEQYTGSWYGLVHAVFAFGIAWLILYWMYRKKTFIKV